MMRMLEALPDRFEVCYEASCGYGHYHDLLSPIAARVTVAHPGRLRLIFRSKDKNDRKDAEWLAKLLYLGETPTVHVPSPEVRAWRELITCRGQVVVIEAPFGDGPQAATTAEHRRGDQGQDRRQGIEPTAGVPRICSGAM